MSDKYLNTETMELKTLKEWKKECKDAGCEWIEYESILERFYLDESGFPMLDTSKLVLK